MAGAMWKASVHLFCCVAGMESAPSEDNLDSKVGNSSKPSLSVQANTASRAYSSDDLRSMGAPMSGPSGHYCPHFATT